jgi:ribosome maturation factor RimP
VNTESLKNLVEEYFASNDLTDYFWVQGNIKEKKIEVFIDGDQGVGFDICKKLSRHLEALFDESLVFGESYTLEVSSPGVGSPLKLPRQYSNNVGRTLEIRKGDQRIKGIIVSADKNGVSLEVEVLKLEGKKKKKIIEIINFAYPDMDEARIKVSFK